MKNVVVGGLLVASLAFTLVQCTKSSDSMSSHEISIVSSTEGFSPSTVIQEFASPENDGSDVQIKAVNYERLESHEVEASNRKEYTDLELYQLGLSPELYTALVEEAPNHKHGFAYENSHWVEINHYDENGSPVLDITNILEFSDKALKAKEKVFNFELDKFQSDSSWGEFSPTIETDITSLLESSLDLGNQHQVDTVNCRSKKCMISISLGDSQSMDILKLHDSAMSILKDNSTKDLSCGYLQWPGYQGAYFLVYHCTPEPQA